MRHVAPTWDVDSECLAVMDLEAHVGAVTAAADGRIAAGDASGRTHFLRLEEPGKADAEHGL